MIYVTTFSYTATTISKVNYQGIYLTQKIRKEHFVFILTPHYKFKQAKGLQFLQYFIDIFSKISGYA